MKLWLVCCETVEQFGEVVAGEVPVEGVGDLVSVVFGEEDARAPGLRAVRVVDARPMWESIYKGIQE